MEFERLVYETVRHGLARQEEVLRELRAGTGVLLGGASVAASFLGREAFDGDAWLPLVALALGAFAVSMVTSIYVLVPSRDLSFTQPASVLYAALYDFREEMSEVYRRIAYDLDRVWERNDARLTRLTRAWRVAAGALVVEILALVVLTSGTIGRP
ncbi:MAG TPA: hypothetical protein VF520_00985 [Thermoleophilaceae bacterium]|jgi:hypothetical protein